MRTRFSSARDNGWAYAIGKTTNREIMEEVIFEAMAINPYKSEKARKDFIDGVSAYVNKMSELRNRRMIYGA